MPIKVRLFPHQFYQSYQPSLYTFSKHIFSHTSTPKNIHRKRTREKHAHLSTRLTEAATMKIQCDVCGKEAAAVFCTADEAALCQNCDNRVHNANKLASKHPRFSLLNPQLKESPRCDICQERQALLFCQEDRALLCRDCDTPIHKANELTKKHYRFLLTGVKLSTAVSSYQVATSSSGSQSEKKIKTSVANEGHKLSNSNANCSETSLNPIRENESSLPLDEQASESTSSISEYLTETLPGWHVDDLFGPSSHYGFCKIDKQVSSFSDEESRCTSGFFIERHASMFTSYSSSSSKHKCGRKDSG